MERRAPHIAGMRSAWKRSMSRPSPSRPTPPRHHPDACLRRPVPPTVCDTTVTMLPLPGSAGRGSPWADQVMERALPALLIYVLLGQFLMRDALAGSPKG